MASMDDIMRAVLACVPTTPSSTGAGGTLSAAFSYSPGGGGVDRISCLPDEVLSIIVSRLPVKDAARTAVLSSRWRHLWRSTPLVFNDADLLPDLDDDQGGRFSPFDWRAFTATVSRVLAVHPGPFRCVHLTNACNYAAYGGGATLSRWLCLLAAKAVHELVLVKFPNWPLSVDLPAEVLRVASLRRLYLGIWDKFPDIELVDPCAHAFPHLVELGICCTNIETKDLDRLLQCSPVLEKLALVLSCNTPPDVRVRSRSLRCMLFWMSIAKEITVVVAPRLERLILRNDCPGSSPCADSPTSVKIGYTPELKVIGYLQPGIHVLEIANTVIEAATKPSTTTMVPSVKILALKVRFGVRNEAKMLPTFLRCFPNVQTLHVASAEADEPTGKLNSKFWHQVGPIECLDSHIKRVVFKNYLGSRGELAFLRFVLERARLLQRMVIVLAEEDPASSKESAATKLKPLACSTKRASRDPDLMILVRSGGTWSFRAASDLSLCDPFDC